MDEHFFPIIEVVGSPYECGVQYGVAASELIKKNISIYLDLIQYHSGRNSENTLELARRYLEVVKNFDPKLILEMQGVADGAMVDLEEILMLNCRTELLSSVNINECTAFSIISPASKDNVVWVGQNWDWLNATRDTIIILKIKQIGMPAIIMVVEAGQIGKMGFNSTGIGLCHNALEYSYQKMGLPFLVLCRIVLNQSQIHEALNILGKIERGASGNFLITHAGGVSIDFEFNPDRFDYFEPINGIIVHTNHFISEVFKSGDYGLINDGWDSIIRRQRALYLLQKAHGAIDLDVLRDVQQDAECGDASICVKPVADGHWAEQWETLTGVIMNLSELKLFYSCGSPLKNQYHEIGL